jgi:CrcB protein
VLRNFIFIGLGGALGSMLRFGCSLLIGSKTFPFSTLLINITGSIIIGAVIAYSLKNETFSDNWKLFLATGICGGFTTFSSFSFENLQLFENGKFGMLAIYIGASVLLGIAGVWTGFKLINLVTN